MILEKGQRLMSLRGSERRLRGAEVLGRVFAEEGQASQVGG
jgi:hypothetical protein